MHNCGDRRGPGALGGVYCGARTPRPGSVQEWVWEAACPSTRRSHLVENDSDYFPNHARPAASTPVKSTPCSGWPEWRRRDSPAHSAPLGGLGPGGDVSPARTPSRGWMGGGRGCRPAAMAPARPSPIQRRAHLRRGQRGWRGARCGGRRVAPRPERGKPGPARGGVVPDPRPSPLSPRAAAQPASTARPRPTFDSGHGCDVAPGSTTQRQRRPGDRDARRRPDNTRKCATQHFRRRLVPARGRGEHGGRRGRAARGPRGRAWAEGPLPWWGEGEATCGRRRPGRGQPEAPF